VEGGYTSVRESERREASAATREAGELTRVKVDEWQMGLHNLLACARILALACAREIARQLDFSNAMNLNLTSQMRAYMLPEKTYIASISIRNTRGSVRGIKQHFRETPCGK
jgi:hypothetical protein